MTFSSFMLFNEMQIVRTGELRNRIAKRTALFASVSSIEASLLPYVACRMRQIEQCALEGFVRGAENVIRRKSSRDNRLLDSREPG
ncbi:unnamed protein product [Lasius platythorax]|uniref:Uncharacterized protein n=1 Tax=Lasius platythorax TaxID=488582 RepID=A0AAV2P244_9HYME